MFLICLSLGMMNQDFGSRLGARSDKESPEVEITNDEEVEITNVVIPVNVNEEEDEITNEVYELKRREKVKIIEESRSIPFPTPIRSPRIHTDIGRYTYLFEHLKARFMSRKSFDTLADHLQEVMVESLPIMVDTHIKEKVKKQVPKQKSIDNHIPSQVDASVRSYMFGNILHVHPAHSQTLSVPEQQYQLYHKLHVDLLLFAQEIRMILMMMLILRERIIASDRRLLSMKYMCLESHSSGKVNENEQGLSTSGNQEQEDDYDFWTESYASDDDEIPTKQMSQDIMEEVSLTIDEAKLKKMVDEMLRQRCTSGDEHQYHIDQMKNFLKSDIVWESRKEILVSPHPRKTTPLVQSCQRDPEAPPLSLINQDLLYLKKGSSGPEKIVLSLHKFPAIIFNDDDIEERTSRWVNKILEGLRSYNNDVKYGYIQRDLTNEEVEYLKLFEEEIELEHEHVASLGSSFKSPLRGLKSVHLGKLHTKAVVVQKEFGDKILVPVPDLSQRPLKIEKICLDCGDPVHGLYCRQCALIRKTLEEVFQDFQDTSKSSNDDTKLWLIKAISLSKQDPGVNSSQSPQINHNCCYECGDSLDDIFCQRCTSFKEHSETIIDSNDDSTSSDDDSYENIDYVDASPPDAEIVSLEVVEIVIPEVGGIDTDILLTIKDDILREKLLNVNLLIANIEALKDNPAPSSDKSSGSTTTHSDYSLPDYEAFYFDDDHIEEKSSGSTTTHADFSQYDSFIFDLSINPFPPADRSDFYHEEFADELAHIISPSEYDHFCFKIEPELGNLTMDVVEDIFPTREPRVHVPNVLSTHPTLDTDFILLSEPLFAYIVWIFLPFLTYPVAPPYLLSCGNEDTIFDPGISIYHSFMPGCPGCLKPLGFVLHSPRASHPQLHFGNPIS
ncbi:hypothetical protein Tco_0894461 [Tanacetum coccineum]|uniref:Uncharacterized protein n=1 Tax=Tanacetum coccineum TaxID=301880 RepID=A0ABQ5CH98_9ASTR